MSDNKNPITMKILITIATVIYGVVPAIADVNETHLLNPEWSPHARVHGAWFLFFGWSMAMMSLFFLWVKDWIYIPCFVGLMFASGFWVAFLLAPLYGGSLTDPNGIEAKVLGLDGNVFTFSLVSAVLLSTLAWKRASQARVVSDPH
ncbi:MAG: DUF6640 family protein [Pseudomonadota bacterium]